MDASRYCGHQVFVYRHPVDMRKGAAGLSALISAELGRDPADRCIYVFSNRARNRVKLLVWHLDDTAGEDSDEELQQVPAHTRKNPKSVSYPRICLDAKCFMI